MVRRELLFSNSGKLVADMATPTSEYETLEKILKIFIKYHDGTIAISVMLLLFLDSILINSFPQAFLVLDLFLVFILVIDILFNLDSVLKIVPFNNRLNTTSKKVIEKFLKAIFYIIILLNIIISPPEVPLTFVLPQLASIDYYFLLTSLLITGLYFSLFTFLKIIFLRKSNPDPDIHSMEFKNDF